MRVLSFVDFGVSVLDVERPPSDDPSVVLFRSARHADQCDVPMITPARSTRDRLFTRLLACSLTSALFAGGDGQVALGCFADVVAGCGPSVS
jgi:hypothetical protein